ATAGDDALAPSLMRPTTVLMPTVFPSSTRISANVPAAGEGISVSTLSVEISKRGSSRSTRSPDFLSHLVRVPSTMLSPIWGITTSVISVLPLSSRNRCIEQHLAVENTAKVRSQPAAHLVQTGAHAERLHGGDRLSQSAGDNVLEIAQIRSHVQRKTMGRHPAADMHADGGD